MNLDKLAIDILSKAKIFGVEIHLDNENLRIRVSNKEKVNTKFIEEIKNNKKTLIDFIKKENLKKINSINNPIIPFNRNGISHIPLSYAQERLWFIDKLNGSIEYHQPTILRLEGKLDKVVLESAFRALVDRHELLRTVIKEKDGVGYQEILHVDNWAMNYVNDYEFTGEDDLQKYIEALIARPYDLSVESILRIHLIRLSEEEHILLVMTHHIGSDGWSLGIIIDEFIELYSALEEEREISLPELPIQYADYAVWQREYLSEEMMALKMDYWQQQLLDYTALELPMDYPRPLIQSIKGSSLRFNIDGDLYLGLKKLCKEEDVTLFMLLVSVFKIMLSRYSGQDDIVIGIPIAGRDQQELEGLIGFFVNSLVLRNNLGGNPFFKDFLSSVKQTTLDAYSNQEVPFEQLVEILEADRDLNRNPIFQVCMQVLNVPDAKSESNGLGDLELSYFDNDRDTSIFDLRYDITETSDGLHITIEYCVDLFRDATIVQMFKHYELLLSSVIADPEVMINDLKMLTKEDRYEQLQIFNGTTVDYPRDKTIVDLFEDQVEAVPNSIALVYEDSVLTYQVLNERSNQLSHYLVAQGVCENSLVGICMARSLDMIIGILGILKSGGGYVPIDSKYPESRIDYMIADTGMGIVLSSGDRTGLFKAQKHLLTVDLDHFVYSDYSVDSLNLQLFSDSLAYVMYTSGSTGRPKGVMVNHKNVTSLLNSIDGLEIKSSDIILSTGSPSFDASTFEYWNMLLFGGVLILTSESTLLDYFRLERLVLTHRVTIMWFTSGLFNQLIEINTTIFSRLHSILVGGEKLSSSHVDSLLLENKSIAIYNGYGPTENTTFSITYKISEVSSKSEIPIGIPLNNREGYILSSEESLLPKGVTGELYVGGEGLSRGYLNNPEMTSEKFIDHLFKSNGRLYKTGDLVRWLSHGNIEFIGRRDDQVKIRGYRIEMGEVESVVISSGMVSQSVVLHQKTDTLNGLIGYYVLDHAVVERKSEDLYQDHIIGWQSIYEDQYEEGQEALDYSFDIRGWNSSFTGDQLTDHNMRLWLDDILSLITKEKTNRVLEVGIGTGMIYYGLVASGIEYYKGTDFSSTNLSMIRSRISDNVSLYPVTELELCAAHELDKTNVPEDLDTIVINSVVQYFPGERYLGDVLSNCIEMLPHGGRIIIGDVRDYRLLDDFHRRLLKDRYSEGLRILEYEQYVLSGALMEEELCVSPGYFYGLQDQYEEITGVEIVLKSGDYENELSLYRYNVVLHIGSKKTTNSIAPDWLSWDATFEDIEEGLGRGTNRVYYIKDVPNPRLIKEQQLRLGLEDRYLKRKGDLFSYSSQKYIDSISRVSRLLNMADSKGYYSIRYASEDPFKMYLVLSKTPVNERIIIRYNFQDIYQANIPLYAEATRILEVDIESYVSKKLPDYMCPSRYINIPIVPLTHNGKVDKKSLLAYSDVDYVLNIKNYVAPRNAIENKLAIIWQDLLGLERVGIYDNFFELGGHSLLATRVISMVRKELELEVSVKDLFTYATIEGLAVYLGTQSPGLLIPSIVIQDRSERIPLSFAQERLWFIDKLQGSVQYHQPIVLRLEGKLESVVLESVFNTLVDRHELLRTVIYEEDGVGYQQIQDADSWVMNYIDDKVFEKENDLEDYIDELIAIPYDLSKDSVLRVHLIRLSEKEHVLLVMTHHIGSDGWSQGVMIDEFIAFYNALEEGKEVVLPELLIQYADYALWQRGYLGGKLLETKLRYWGETLSGIEPLELATDYIRPAIQSTKGASTGIKLDGSLSVRLQEFCKEKDVTLFMFMLSVFKVLLYRYSGQGDLCVGSPIAGRTQQELEGLIGFFVNTLVLRSTFDGETSFDSLLEQVKVNTLGAYDHQDVPFEKIVDHLGLERDRSRSPLFQVMFVLQNTPDSKEDLSMGSITIDFEGSSHVTSLFDLTFSITEHTNGLHLGVEYCSDLFSDVTIEKMLVHYQELLLGVVKDSTTMIGDLDMLTVEEKQELLEIFNDTEVAYPKNKTVIDLFEEQVQAVPDTIALVYEDSVLTYAELNKRSNQLGYYLKEKGIEANSLVGICLDRSLDMIIGILGIMKVGGAYVPIDPEYPAGRIAHIIEDTGIGIVLSKGLSTEVFKGQKELLIVDLNRFEYENHAIENQKIHLSINSLAYVIYTSGSTGKPKGVMNDHSGIFNRLQWAQDTFCLTNIDVVLQKTTFCFDVSVWELLWPLMYGSRLVFAKLSGEKDPDYLKEVIYQNNITTIHFVPSMLQVFLLDISKEYCKSLNRVLCSGEALQVSQVITLREKLGRSIGFYNLYGPTEAAIDITYWSIPQEVSQLEVIPIGSPISNTNCYVLNADLELLPRKAIGELYVSGIQVSRGYLNRLELTSDKFIDNPFNKSERLYKTGDLARWNSDGELEFINRSDDQVKIRGYRIELGEIEAILNGLSEVKQAVVLAREDKKGNKRLVGYVVVKEIFDTDQIQMELGKMLPGYMIPKIWIDLEVLPLTSNGKLDRKRLPDPDMETLSTKEYVAPRNEIEKKLAIIWQNVLEVDKIGVYDNFFELGGNSLFVVKVVSRIKKELEFEMLIKDLFEFKSIDELASYFEMKNNIEPEKDIEDYLVNIKL